MLQFHDPMDTSVIGQGKVSERSKKPQPVPRRRCPGVLCGREAMDDQWQLHDIHFDHSTPPSKL
jgi:tRNA-dihydrouridine synthase